MRGIHGRQTAYRFTFRILRVFRGSSLNRPVTADTTAPTPPGAGPSAPCHRRSQTHVSAIFGLLASSRRLMASLIMRGRSSKRFVFSDGCCFTLLFMQPRPRLSIRFPRAKPCSTIRRFRQSLRLRNGTPQPARSVTPWPQAASPSAPAVAAPAWPPQRTQAAHLFSR